MHSNTHYQVIAAATLETERELISAEPRRSDSLVLCLPADLKVASATNDQEQDDPRARRYKEWEIGQSQLPATTRLVLRVILLHEGSGGRVCTASDCTIAREASLSESQVRAVLRRAATMRAVFFSGHHHKTVTLPPTPESIRSLHAKWFGGRHLLAGYFSGSLPEREMELTRWKDPYVHVTMCEDEEEAERALQAIEREAVGRFWWIRELVADPQLSVRPLRKRRRRGGGASVKGVAFAIDLLMNGEGRPFGWTCVAELVSLSGYEKDAVIAALKVLEDGGWIEVLRQRGRGGGLLIRLRFPPDVRERVQLRQTLQYGGQW